ncbi:MAG: OmpA family protein [Muribaculaceae bacterium]|nr:OmpA family protein [Muribaculaceae bacterium]
MKNIITTSVLALGAIASASAQQAIATPKFGDNWSLGIKGGVTTPMSHSPFFGGMRPVVGIDLSKKLTPVFKLGAEGDFAINTSTQVGRGPRSKTAFDDSYLGAYGAVNLFNLFGGYPGSTRPFDIDLRAGAGWGRSYETAIADINYFATKFGLDFNFNVSDYVTVSVSPSFIWNMTGQPVRQSTASYDKNRANFNLTAGVAYNFGGNGFKVVEPYNQAQIDELNSQINNLRGSVNTLDAANAALKAKNGELEAENAALRNRAPQVVTQVKNNLESVRYVFFKLGSSAIGADQQPNVEMIAAYLNNHPNSKVVIKGYASKDGPEEVNIRLANQRAQSVKDALMKRYKIPASRIVAEGQGIGEMFEEESWNRVAICILEAK